MSIDAVKTILMDDPLRLQALSVVRQLGLPDCWIGAGFLRDAVWDHLHGHAPRKPEGDIDVIWFDTENSTSARDRDLENRLRELMGDLDWSVKNQARMHFRNGDAPYRSVAHAMTAWPETATAIAVRMTDNGGLEIRAPLGIDDLFAMRLRPTPTFMGCKRAIFEERIAGKRWLERYPLVTAG